MSKFEYILAALPYQEPFLFVDEILHLDESRAEGTYRFKKDEYFYEGHFKNHPVTPGVILTECMAQIGVVCLGIFLVQSSKLKVKNVQNDQKAPVGGLGAQDEGNNLFENKGENSPPAPKGGGAIALTESHINFLKPVYPGEQVRVVSKKKYFRLGKLKCDVEMFDEVGERVCYGQISGMIGDEGK